MNNNFIAGNIMSNHNHSDMLLAQFSSNDKDEIIVQPPTDKKTSPQMLSVTAVTIGLVFVGICSTLFYWLNKKTAGALNSQSSVARELAENQYIKHEGVQLQPSEKQLVEQSSTKSLIRLLVPPTTSILQQVVFHKLDLLTTLPLQEHEYILSSDIRGHKIVISPHIPMEINKIKQLNPIQTNAYIIELEGAMGAEPIKMNFSFAEASPHDGLIIAVKKLQTLLKHGAIISQQARYI